MRRTILGLSAILVVAGCSSSDRNGAPETTKAVGQKIVGGTPDTTHDAVVALLSKQSECTGTIVATDATHGYVLTAAHCVPANDKPTQVIVGTDYNNPKQVFTVSKTASDPLYVAAQQPPSNHDFGMVQFTLGGKTPPAPIGVLTPATDDMKGGDILDFIGYGVVVPPNGNNSKRNHVLITLSAVGQTQIDWNGSATADTCSGDSGGPALYTLGGTEFVGGVTSFGPTGCVPGYAVSGRASVDYDCFIKPFIDGVAGPACTPDPTLSASCNTCDTTASTGTCKSTIDACKASPDCINYNECIGVCGNLNACYTECQTLYPAGAKILNDINDCICFSACPAECVSDCNGPMGACGFTPSDATCQTCMESKCCSEGTACYGDATCRMCEDASTPMGCDGNALAGAYNSCIANNCATECNVPAGTGGSGGGTGTGGAGPGAGGTGPGPGAGGTGAGVGAGGAGPGPGAGGTGPGGPGAGGTGVGPGTGGNGAGTGGTTAAGTGGMTTGAGGAATGTGGKSTTGAGGATGAGAGGKGAAGTGGATTGTGGHTTTAGLGGATSATGTGGDTGTAGTSTDATAGDDSSSGSSGGCSVPVRGNGGAAGLLLAAAAFVAARRRRA